MTGHISNHLRMPFQVREDAPTGFVVGPITSRERPATAAIRQHGDSIGGADADVHITYTITSLTSDVVDGAFEMDRITGSLVVARALDREQQSEYRLEIRALDTTASNNPQSSAVTVRVEIADVNDNAPVWLEDPITVPVSENTVVGAVVYNFTAFDADAGPNGDLQYALIAQHPPQHTEQTLDGQQASSSLHSASAPVFAIDPLTGALSVQQALDYERLAEYLLIVEATDTALNRSERLSTACTVRIVIGDENDNAPVFVSPSSSDAVIVLSDATGVGQVVAHVVAVDADSGANGRVTYGIVAGNEDDHFHIDALTGDVRVLKPLVRPTAAAMAVQAAADNGMQRRDRQYAGSVMSSGRFTLTVAAVDGGLPVGHETRTVVQLVVQGASQHPPRFVESVYHANVTENMAAGVFVVRVLARSQRGDNGEYNLLNGDVFFEVFG